MSKLVCKIAGIALALVGIVGFFAPNLMGMHLTPIHDVVHLASAAVALYFGFAGSNGGARTFLLVFGAVYGLLGVLGFVAPGIVAMVIGMPGLTAGQLLPDNLVHIVIGIAFIGAGAMDKGR
jgi:hypothetical protein